MLQKKIKINKTKDYSSSWNLIFTMKKIVLSNQIAFEITDLLNKLVSLKRLIDY